MSHIVQIQTEIRDVASIQAACDRLSLPRPIFGETKLFSSTVTGWAVQLPEWRFPIVCDVATAQIAFDNFSGRWGNETQLHKFVQAYAVERAKREARRQGHSVQEQLLTDGSIRLQIAVSS
ncbi:MAG: DUF1257 domain-containing protein [Planctomycetaceae bacterium]